MAPRSASWGRAWLPQASSAAYRSEEHTSELQSQFQLVCRLLLEKKKANDSSRCHGAAGWTYAHAGEGFTETVTTDPVGATTTSHAPAVPFTLTAPAQGDSRPVAL